MVMPALGGQTVHQQREIEIAALRAEFFGIAVERFKLVVGDHAGIVKQPPDQRGFAVIDRAAGDEAEKILLLLGLQVGLDVAAGEFDEAGHQKYPSCFFFSIAPA